ncbi:peptide-methionine (S)-S-oxide reductase [Saprolegnia diclina VS20]|uniref:peptide-methionine (S)-S-oxide reductase n=1 Tax=Saprolegnia diclina (strain VS20) TaxID=1156394 RepID=T0RY64_SAPDV|nr:peptide-methionine (S)-S-oxide reductase [Saprolegnia diclina VS20]EQC35322.1 peptide-methionine (S)-S-oxide reductase [Saprolegnia diclina VS20]|eukprot:XP_008611072.1 peptide-methionine (S)-S-oxide reductase [Saprolegnia diclina VS20]
MTKTVPVTLEPNEALATFAAGCFWSVQLNFQRLEGVVDSHVGYINGTTENPSYKQVCKGDTNHAEAVQIKFDESKITYKQLLDKFFEIHDPTTVNRQKEDIGTQYRSGIFYHNEEQRVAAEEAKAQKAEAIKAEVATEIVPAGIFYHAEDYHQKYLEKGGQCSRVGSTDQIRCYG